VTEEKNRRESSGPKDALDLGVRMAPGEPGEGPQGPEDALDPNARGDYTDRLGGGASYQSQIVRAGTVVRDRGRLRRSPRPRRGGRGELLATCTGITRRGDRCKGIAIDSSGYCYAHHPDHVEDRRRAARKGGHRGGRGRPQTELANIKERLSDLAEDVLEGRQDKGVAAVAGQLLNTYIRAVAVELKAREQLEIIERLEALEASSSGASRVGRGWGA
jgi:hypothetical protein